MRRAIILLMDSFGIGASLDAEKFGDKGADTFGHIVEYCAENKANNTERNGPLQIPNLLQLGLAHAALASTAKRLPNIDYDFQPTAKYGYCVEQSYGKDTPSGHWEIAGVPVLFEWGYFPPEYPSFPEKLINEFIQQSDIPGVLGNKHASGTEILTELAEEHIETGKPIVYTSGDSVFQIAAHEEHFGLDRLYELCEIARELVNEYNVGRVIARPFIGEKGNYTRTSNRKDLSTPPPSKTILEKLVDAAGSVYAIGKVADIYAHQGISEVIKGENNLDLFDKTLETMDKAENNSIIFTNFVDFDSKYGHRRNTAGYAKALEDFDAHLPELQKKLQPDDIVIIAADHGCDPTLPGSDHTREHIPLLVFGPNIKSEFLGRRDSFADIGQTLSQYFELSAMDYGNGFLE